LQQQLEPFTHAHPDELLPAVDVKGGACKGRICHDVYGQRGNIGWSDHPADPQRGAQLLATGFQSSSKSPFLATGWH